MVEFPNQTYVYFSKSRLPPSYSTIGTGEPQDTPRQPKEQLKAGTPLSKDTALDSPDIDGRPMLTIVAGFCKP